MSCVRDRGKPIPVLHHRNLRVSQFGCRVLGPEALVHCHRQQPQSRRKKSPDRLPALLHPKDPEIFYQILRNHQVTVLNQTPSAFYLLATKAITEPGIQWAARYVIFGGEALNPLRLKEWQAAYPKTKLINMFGITETTVHVTYKEVTRREIESVAANIGKPIPTASIYIVDKDLELVVPGVAGELLVGGEGVARGYLNQPDLTAEKFVTNPYKPGERCYRSGDLVRFLAGRDGDMEYLGRIDQQVQVRGYRVEPGEIENRLRHFNGIKDALVIPRGNEEGNPSLCAYIVPDKTSTAELDSQELREYLSGMLPGYMIPDYFTRIDKIPLTANGKLDRQALPEPGTGLPGEAYIPPVSQLEKQLTETWSEVLQVEQEKIGREANFFQLGGHSIRATILVSKIHKKFNVKVPLIEIFNISKT